MSKIRKSWEEEFRTGEVHSPRGIRRLREIVKAGLTRQYLSIAESMFRWETSDERFEAMAEMSLDTVPERWLLDSGGCAFFELGDGSIHCLPCVWEGGLNFYGKPAAWRVIPVGWSDIKPNPPAFVDLHDMVFTHEDSVLMREDDFEGSTTRAYIESMVDMLVDNIATVNQLQLIAKSPFIFNVTQDNLLSAKNYFLAICQDRPAIFQNTTGGESTVPQVERLDVRIDPALFEIADRVECMIMEFLGIPCVPITKRAQQSVAEVESTGDQIDLRRLSRFQARQRAVDRINAKWGTDLRVVSVLDEMEAEHEEDTEGDAPGDREADTPSGGSDPGEAGE